METTSSTAIATLVIGYIESKVFVMQDINHKSYKFIPYVLSHHLLGTSAHVSLLNQQ